MDIPIYNISEAAHYLKLATATLRSWVIGRNYPRSGGTAHFEPLIKLPENGRLLSFNNLIEAYVLRSLRQQHRVSINDVRQARNYAESRFRISRLLLRKDLLTAAGELFLERYGELINISKSGQIALKQTLEEHLSRIEWDHNLPVRLYPYINRDNEKVIAIDPYIKFGRPIVLRKAISTSIIVDRINAGESQQSIADDYDLNIKEVDMAIQYENAA